MQTSVPVRDVRDTAAFSRLVDECGVVLVTRNGYPAFHAMSDAVYRRLEDSEARARLLERLLVAETEDASGQSSDFDAFCEEVDRAYGL